VTAAPGGDGVVVLIPVKAFHHAKVRLADVLSTTERAKLARSMAAHVIQCAKPLPVSIVCDDPDVADWARSVGAAVIWSPGKGLNGAVNDGIDALVGSGARRVIVAHADLPHAAALAPIGDFDGVTLVPDRRDDGTNVACIPTSSGFRFQYGPGSFDRHRSEAERLGLPLRVARDERLAWDVDVPDDLATPDFIES
jgi:2-phospho-L-lactate guanylyltransferase